MTDDKWNNFETTVKTWQKANKGWNDEGHDNYSEDLDSLTTLMKKGKKNEDRRSRIMSTVRTLFMDITSSPFKTGKASTMDSKLLEDYNSDRTEARTALITLWNTNFFQRFAVKSKRGGGGVFADAETFADYELASFDARVHSAIRGSSKDYQYVKGKALKNLIVQKVVETPEAPSTTE
tara:strand:+ start:653 stop:1189 length:537 start_codon:yes stop_codon:yes gene_type:complete